MSIDFLKSIYFEFISYFVVKKQKYVITGSCSKCGKCCREIRAYGMKDEKDLKFMQLIFPWYKRFYILKKDENNELTLSCKYLSEDGSCKVYKFRPFICRNYPERIIYKNLEMIDGCGYKVIKKDFKDYLKT